MADKGDWEVLQMSRESPPSPPPVQESCLLAPTGEVADLKGFCSPEVGLSGGCAGWWHCLQRPHSESGQLGDQGEVGAEKPGPAPRALFLPHSSQSPTDVTSLLEAAAEGPRA